MEGNKGFCQDCGRNFEKKHLSSNIHQKLKRNISHFRNFFKIEKGSTFKICRKCENEWVELNKIVDKQKINEFIDKMKNKKETILVPNNEQSNKKEATLVTNDVQSAKVKEYVPLVDDDHLGKDGPSGVKEQNSSRISDNVSIDDVTIDYYEQPLNIKRKVTVRHYSHVKTETQNLLLSNKIPKLEIQEILDLGSLTGLDTSEVTLDNDDKTKERKIDSLFVPGPSGIKKTDNLKVNNEIINTEGMNTGGNYEHWYNLWKEKHFSDEIGPKIREEIFYYKKKMSEAKEHGIAYEDIKDKNYWGNLWKDKFASFEAGPIYLEDMHYFVEKMKETDKQTEKE